MKTIAIDRRQLLRGAGGATLALPFLPSLFPRRADGADLVGAPKRRLYVVSTDHGAVEANNFYPSASLLGTKVTLFPGHDISYGPLTRTVQGTNTVLSPVLTAATTTLNDRLLSKMNVMRGIGMPFLLAHQGGGHLGNFAGNTGQSDDANALRPFPWPTLDNYLAWSPSFYTAAELTSVRLRSVFFGQGGEGGPKSWTYSNTATRSGTIQAVDLPTSGTLALYDRLFGTGATPPPAMAPAPRKSVVDKVIEHYRSVRNGNRRLSPADKQRLDDHLTRLSELERLLTVSAKPLNCGQRPTEDVVSGGYSFRYESGNAAKAVADYALVNEVLALAFVCGATRVAFIAPTFSFTDFTGDWHGNVAHNAGNPTSQQLLVQGSQRIFESVLLDMARRLDVDDGSGTTVLDNSIVYWSHEAGEDTHWQANLPIVHFGGAGGFIRTGQFIDYRNMGSAYKDPLLSVQVGLTYQRWLAIMAQGMGVPRAEFERDGVQGYGKKYFGKGFTGKYVAGVVETASEVPIPLKA